MTAVPTRGRAGHVGRILGGCAGLGAAGWLIGRSVHAVAGERMAPWILGRAAGVTAYLLLVVGVLSGMVLSHPWRSRVARPSAATRIRVHITLTVFAFAFTALHVAVLATDSYAGVGWWGALVPMGASYRPGATTLGLMGTWVALLAGGSAALAGRLPRRAWWPLHKVAAGSLVLVWLHGLLGGGDTPALLVMYVLTAVLVMTVAVTRYIARTPADRRADGPLR